MARIISLNKKYDKRYVKDRLYLYSIQIKLISAMLQNICELR